MKKVCKHCSNFILIVSEFFKEDLSNFIKRKKTNPYKIKRQFYQFHRMYTVQILLFIDAQTDTLELTENLFIKKIFFS